MNIINNKIARFTEAHTRYYQTAFAEIKKGKKLTDWMWFIFPQCKGLGKSTISDYYAINSIEEANAFMDHPILSEHLIAIILELMQYYRKTPESIFGELDARKLNSSMTLFSKTENANPIFREVLNSFFYGYEDKKTLLLLESQEQLVASLV
ncbi:MAG: DUF1810 family protein [Flavobacterium sp.]